MGLAILYLNFMYLLTNFKIKLSKLNVVHKNNTKINKIKK